MSNNETNKATVKVVRQQIHEINDIRQKYKDIASKYRDSLNAFADLSILNGHLRGENKKLKVLLQVATKEIVHLKVKFVWDLSKLWENSIYQSGNTFRELVEVLQKKWEAKKL